MKIYRSLLAILLFFIVIYALKGYIRPPEYGVVGNFSFPSTLSHFFGTSSEVATSTTATTSTSTLVQNEVKDQSSESPSYSPNRDKLPPVIGKNNADSADGKLTDDGVFFDTNIERGMQSLPILKRNSVLDRTAQIKLNDMFSNQYFEHVSPSGKGVSDIMNTVGYKYLVVGENLALGNFAGDSKVVAAWMASEGHRANILDKRYTEMGVAVGYGMYKGQKQWLAVQHFARPMSSCPSPNTTLKEKISTDKDYLAQKEEYISSTKKVVDATESSDSNFQFVVSSYNTLVNDYNNKLKTLRLEIADYNEQVKNFNSCLDSVTTSTN